MVIVSNIDSKQIISISKQLFTLQLFSHFRAQINKSSAAREHKGQNPVHFGQTTNSIG